MEKATGSNPVAPTIILVMSKGKIYFEVLSNQQRGLLPKLRFLKKEGFYLAGGTALALQMGHRTSVDFDFYTQRLFDPETLYRKFKRYVFEIEKQHTAWGTLSIKKKDVSLSFFYYDYPLLQPLIDIGDTCLLSLEDIAAMKLEAIIQRGIKRDFLDICFLLRRFGLRRMFDFAQKKYHKAFNEYQALLALLYFQDAEAERKQKRYRIIQKISWEGIKKEITQQVHQFKQEELTR